MSGGSFNYLYLKDANEILAYQEDLQNMAQTLAESHPGSAASQACNDLLTYVEDFEYTYNAMKQRLSEVMKAVEWHQSNDWSKDAVDKAVKKFEKDTLEGAA